MNGFFSLKSSHYGESREAPEDFKSEKSEDASLVALRHKEWSCGDQPPREERSGRNYPRSNTQTPPQSTPKRPSFRTLNLNSQKVGSKLSKRTSSKTPHKTAIFTQKKTQISSQNSHFPKSSMFHG